MSTDRIDMDRTAFVSAYCTRRFIRTPDLHFAVLLVETVELSDPLCADRLLDDKFHSGYIASEIITFL